MACFYKDALTLLLASSQREEERLLPIDLGGIRVGIGLQAPSPAGRGLG